MPVELREGAMLAGRFRLDRRLGEGGMGVVWAATNTATGRRVAIKMLRDANSADPHVRRRFGREARAASAVQHPNVVEILDVVELEDQTPAMVMELLEGESLGQRLRRQGKFALPELARIMVHAASAIGSAHAIGIVHRDLKPDNVFLARGHEDVEVVKVLDFGIAKITAETDTGQSQGLTGTGAMLGTPYYMAPEQLFSDETLDYRCDIWALGVILYECLSGVRPTRGDNFADIVKVIATQAIVPFSQVAADAPPEIADLVGRMLSFDKEKRPQSLREVRDVLAHYTDALASTFGEPKLVPVKQTRDADASGETPGLRRADVALLLADEPESGPRAAETLDAPEALEESAKLRAALASRRIAETQDGVPDTAHGVGMTAPPERASSTKLYVLGAAAAIVIAALGAKVAMTPGASVANASDSIPNEPKRPPAPPPIATATTATSATPDTAATPSATPAASATPSATARPSARPIATARPTATAPAATTKPASTSSASSPGGLVEKPPF